MPAAAYQIAAAGARTGVLTPETRDAGGGTEEGEVGWAAAAHPTSPRSAFLRAFASLR